MTTVRDLLYDGPESEWDGAHFVSTQYPRTIPDGWWREFAGVYILAMRPGHTTQWLHAGLGVTRATAARLTYFDWSPLYIGRTGDLGRRLRYHNKLDEAERRGMTHVHVHHEPLGWKRRELEERLIKLWQPPLNSQYRDR